MATPAQCAYCFEVLAANLEKRKPLSLEQVSDLWEAWIDADNTDGELAEDVEEAENAPSTPANCLPGRVPNNYLSDAGNHR